MSHIPPAHKRLEVVEERLRDPSSELNIDSLLVSKWLFLTHMNTCAQGALRLAKVFPTSYVHVVSG